MRASRDSPGALDTTKSWKSCSSVPLTSVTMPWTRRTLHRVGRFLRTRSYRWMRGGRLCRLEMSDPLDAGRVGPQVVAVGISFEGPAAFVDQPMMEGAEPGGV